MKEWKKAEECEKDVKQAEYKASRNEAKRSIARVQAEVMKKQAETLDSKEGRQNIYRIAKQEKKERKDITGTNCLKGDNGELLVSEESCHGLVVMSCGPTLERSWVLILASHWWMTGRAPGPKMLTAPTKSQLTIGHCPSPVKTESV